MTERLAGLESGYDGLQHSQRILVAAVCFGGGAIGIALLVIIGLMIYGFDAQSRRIDRLEARIDSLSTLMSGKIDAVPERIDRQFQAMQMQTATQTSAIANAITAARQLTPPVVFQPTPQTPEPATSASPSSAEEAPAPAPPPPSRPTSRRR